MQYADYAVWQQQWLQGPVQDTLLAHWRTALADLATLELPTDRPRPAAASYRGGTVRFAIPQALTQSLKELSRRERVDVVHDVARRLPDPPVPIQRAGGCRSRRAHGGTQPAAARADDRIFREHDRVARRSVRQSEVSEIPCAGKEPRARRLHASGAAVREAGGGARTEARSVPQSAVPGVARPEQHAPWTLGGARPRRAANREHYPRHGEVRCLAVPAQRTTERSPAASTMRRTCSMPRRSSR